MPLTHLLVALAVAFVWGTNFVVIKHGLADFPPFLFAALRFVFSCLPWVLFIGKPPVSWGKLAAFGLFQGAGQFGLLYYAMRADISAGLASLVVQSQVFFTIGAAVLWLGERIRMLQAGALGLAAAGVGIIAWRSAADSTAAVTLFGVMLTLGAGLSWAASNLVARSAGRVNMLGFVVWSSLFAILPLVGFSVWLDPPSSQVDSLAHAGPGAWCAVLWQALGNTLFGYGCWNWLLAHHPSWKVVPVALLVPIFGIGASWLLLDESLPPWKLAAACLIVASLAVNTFASIREQHR